jgi:hypothetical protein
MLLSFRAMEMPKMVAVIAPVDPPRAEVHVPDDIFRAATPDVNVASKPLSAFLGDRIFGRVVATY